MRGKERVGVAVLSYWDGRERPVWWKAKMAALPSPVPGPAETNIDHHLQSLSPPPHSITLFLPLCYTREWTTSTVEFDARSVNARRGGCVRRLVTAGGNARGCGKACWPECCCWCCCRCPRARAAGAEGGRSRPVTESCLLSPGGKHALIKKGKLNFPQI